MASVLQSGLMPNSPSEGQATDVALPGSVAEVYEAHVDYVFRCLRSLGIREAHVEDAVQDVFIVVNDKLSAFDGQAKLRTWLYAIVIRVARRYRERQAREPREAQRRLGARRGAAGRAPAHLRRSRCNADGSSTCLAIACVDSCTYEGKTYKPGDTFPASDGWNTCSCGANGDIACTKKACNPGTCSYGGKTYKVGDTFTDALGCNGCGCSEQGVVCDARYCDPAQACSKGDSKFASGNSVICEDGCNTCSCNNTAWSSTLIACGALQKVESCSGQPGVEKVRILYRDGDKLAVEVGTGSCANEQRAFRLCFDGQYRESFPVVP